MKLEDIKIDGKYISHDAETQITTIVQVVKIDERGVWCLNARSPHDLDRFCKNFEPYSGE